MAADSEQMPRLWREPDGALPNTLAFGYAFGGHALGLWLLVQPSIWLFVAGVLLTAHTMVIGAYLVHECGHMTLFRSRKTNRLAAELLLWLLGAGYAAFERVRHMHIRHHRDRADVACFDYQRFLQRRPAWVRRLVVALEWAYIPAVELLMHGQVIVRPFVDPERAADRPRVVVTLLSRLALFVALFLASPWSLLGFALAYVLFLQALFVGDAFAHTYEAYIVDDMHEVVPSMTDRDAPVVRSTAAAIEKAVMNVTANKPE